MYGVSVDYCPLYSCQQIWNFAFMEKVKILSNFTVLIRVIVTNCDLKTPSEFFNEINSNSSLQEITKLFNKEGITIGQI